MTGTTVDHSPIDGAIRRDFSLIWLGQGLAAVGTQITALALPLTAILVLHARAADLGLLNALLWFPFLVLSLPVGVVVDRHRRRPLMIAADAARAALLVVVVILARAGSLSLALLLPLVFLFGCGAVIFELAYQSYIPGLVGTGRLMHANTRLQATNNAAQLGGPALAGVLVQALSAPVALLLNAVSFAVSVITLSAVRTLEPEPRSTATRSLRDLADGLSFTYSNRHLRSLVTIAASYNVFNQWVLTLYLLFAVRTLHLSPALIGVTLSGGTVGAVVGAMLAQSAAARVGLGRAFLGAVVIECLAALLVPLAPPGHWLAVPTLVAAFGLMDFGSSMSSVVAVSVRQTVTPVERLGRMTASYRAVSYGSVPLGAAVGGWVGQVLGLHAGLAMGATALASTMIWAIVSPTSRLRRIEDLRTPAAT